MKTLHRIFFKDAAPMEELPSASIDLVVTSPPYPMIEMWDELFTRQNPAIAEALNRQKPFEAFEQMHTLLDRVWEEVWRVVKPGGIVCVNIGDAVRTLNGDFGLYPNHCRIIQALVDLGFTPLPEILWRKQTNAPNKFMGSGMYPAGAYVTLEHEFILIFRKGGKREFKSEEEKEMRRQSAFFWEERNIWFSDVWFDVKGTSQNLFDDRVRKRSAAFPFETPYRLIQMYSVKGDTVLDPFAGIGTTNFVAIASARHSVAYELEPGFREILFSGVQNLLPYANQRIRQRLEKHGEFVHQRETEAKPLKHRNHCYGFPVMTRQEMDLFFNPLISLNIIEDGVIEAEYEEYNSGEHLFDGKTRSIDNPAKKTGKASSGNQMDLNFLK